MGEEVFQLHVATPTPTPYATYLMSLYKTREAQHGLLSLLVCNRVFFPCWCFTNVLLSIFAMATKQIGRWS